MPQRNMVCSNTYLTGKPEKQAANIEDDGYKQRITREEVEIQLMFLGNKRQNELQAKGVTGPKEPQQAYKRQHVSVSGNPFKEDQIAWIADHIKSPASERWSI